MLRVPCHLYVTVGDVQALSWNLFLSCIEVQLHVPELLRLRFESSQQSGAQPSPLELGIYPHPLDLGHTLGNGTERAHPDQPTAVGRDEELTAVQVLALDVVEVVVPRTASGVGARSGQSEVVEIPNGLVVGGLVAPYLPHGPIICRLLRYNARATMKSRKA